MTLSQSEVPNIPEERQEIYWKLKANFDVLTALLHNEEVNMVHRRRTGYAQVEVEKTIRM